VRKVVDDQHDRLWRMQQEPRSGSRRCPECGRGGALVLNSYRAIRYCRRAAQGGPKAASLVTAARGWAC